MYLLDNVSEPSRIITSFKGNWNQVIEQTYCNQVCVSDQSA